MAKNKKSTNDPILLRKLSQLGSPVDLLAAEEEVAEPRVEITQFGPPSENRIFELDNLHAGYVFGLDILNRTSKPIYFPEIDLCTRWRDDYFQWLTDPQERYRDVHDYSFPGKGGPQFPRAQVLNRLLLSETGVLQPHVPYQGWLLAVGRPMPKELHDRVQVAATLVLVDSNGTEYRQRILLVAERDGVKPESRQRVSGLYQGPAARKIEPAVGESRRSDPGATSRVI